MLAPDLNVADNIFLGDLPGLLPWKQLQEHSRAILKEVGFDLDPKTRLGDLPLAYQQAVEIAKALSKDVKILILDEPTAVLAPPRSEKPSWAGQKAQQTRGGCHLHLPPP